MKRVSSLLIAVLLLGGCERAMPEDVASAANLLKGRWSLGDTLVVLGRQGVHSGALFAVADATILDDDRIAVADAQASVRIFERDGTPVRAIGRRGDGPGEFGRIEAVFVGRGDTIWVAEAKRRSVVGFSLDGEILTEVRLPAALGGVLASVIGFTPSADPLVRKVRLAASSGSRTGRVGPMEPNVNEWYRYDRANGSIVKLAEEPDAELYRHRWGAGGVRGEVIFGARSFAWPWQDGVSVAGQSDRVEVVQVYGDGEVARELLGPNSVREIKASDRERYIEWRLATGPSEMDEAAWRRAFEDSPERANFPGMAGGLTDATGVTWVREYRPPYEQSVEWSVFSHDGEWMGSLELPGDVSVLEIGDDYILGVAEDDLQVETVVVLELIRDGPA